MILEITLAISLLTGWQTTDERVIRISAATADASESVGVEWSMLVALAKHESAFDETAMSSNGSFGPWQLNPRFHREVINKCGMWPGLCLHFQALASAQTFLAYQRRCKGVGRAVAAYRHGHCVEPRSQDMAVVALRNRLTRLFAHQVEP